MKQTQKTEKNRKHAQSAARMKHRKMQIKKSYIPWIHTTEKHTTDQRTIATISKWMAKCDDKIQAKLTFKQFNKRKHNGSRWRPNTTCKQPANNSRSPTKFLATLSETRNTNRPNKMWSCAGERTVNPSFNAAFQIIGGCKPKIWSPKSKTIKNPTVNNCWTMNQPNVAFPCVDEWNPRPNELTMKTKHSV